MTTYGSTVPEIISAYTRRQAIEDGVLVQLSGPGYQGDPWIPAMVAEAGFRYPVAMTATAFCRYVLPLEGDDEKGPPAKTSRAACGTCCGCSRWQSGASKCPAYILRFSLRVVPNVPADYAQAQPAKTQARATEVRVRAGRRRLPVSDDHAARGGLSTMLTFPKRPRKDQTKASDRKLWTSKCRRYRVTFSRCRYGPRDERGIPTCATLNTSTRNLEYGMCCRDIEAAPAPLKGPVNGTPVWRTVRRGELAGAGSLAAESVGQR